VVTQVIRLVNDPYSDVKQIHNIVKKDAAMVSKMLRMVNSVYYGISEPVRDLEQALVILGFKTIRSIALSVSVLNLFQEQNACFNMKAFWTHGAVSASICRLLAKKSRICDPELAFIVGLLKGIGKVVLAENAPTETRSIIAVAREYSLDFHRAAREVLDTDDAEIGAWLCERWQLDPSIIDTIRCQYDLELTKNRPLVSLVQFSEYLCALKNIRVSGNYDQSSLDPSIWKHLGFDKESLIDVLSMINIESENARILLQLGRT
jgi:HD-like signal output (HDOD) protein